MAREKRPATTRGVYAWLVCVFVRARRVRASRVASTASSAARDVVHVSDRDPKPVITHHASSSFTPDDDDDDDTAIARHAIATNSRARDVSYLAPEGLYALCIPRRQYEIRVVRVNRDTARPTRARDRDRVRDRGRCARAHAHAREFNATRSNATGRERARRTICSAIVRGRERRTRVAAMGV